MQTHPFEPVFDENSEILILGTFPSVKSRKFGFYYGHPCNRFWKVLSELYSQRIPDDIASKKKFLLDHHIALWDVICSCDIEGSSDSSIKNVVPNKIGDLLNKSEITAIYTNGKTADRYFKKYFGNAGVKYACLPSTSPANASYSLGLLCEKWNIIKSEEIE